MKRFVAVLLFAAACGGTSVAPPMPDLAIAPAAPDLSGAPPTWTNFAQSFFATYCVSCHNPNGQAAAQDFRSYDMVRANAATIRCGVSPASHPASGCPSTPHAGQFPIGSGPFPSDAERAEIVAWIDANTPM